MLSLEEPQVGSDDGKKRKKKGEQYKKEMSENNKFKQARKDSSPKSDTEH